MAAYRAAEYAVPQAGIVMRIGAPDPALDRLIAAKGGAAFLTAANPGSEQRTDEENRLLLGELRCALDAAGYGYMDGEGRDPSGDWPAERSLFVLGIARAEAMKLAGEIAECSPLGLISTRATMRAGLADRVLAATNHELVEQTRLRATEDFKEGVKATAERRVANFRGR